ncbi:MAG: hypothetical protein ACFB11_16120, partial [Paracoccaceae bacterium]
MFNETIAMSSATTIAVSQIFLSKTMVMVGTKTIRPNGSKKNKARPSNWLTGPSAGFQAGRTLSQTAATAVVDATIPGAIAQQRFRRPISRASNPALS